MKKSRIFMTAGTIALAIAAVFATKANKNFKLITTAFSSGTVLTVKNGESSTGSLAFTNTASVHPVFLNVDGSSISVLKTKTSGTTINTVYFR